MGTMGCGLALASSAGLASLGPDISEQALPAQGVQTYRSILKGGPFPYDKDGVVFGNRERALPQDRARVDQKGASLAVPMGKTVAPARVVLKDVHRVVKAARVAVARRRPRMHRKLTIVIRQRKQVTLGVS